MKTTRQIIKTITCLLLALLLCVEGLLPVAVTGGSEPAPATGLQYAIAEENADGTEGGNAQGGTSSGTNDLDGSKIEGIKVVWVTQDSAKNNDGVATSQAELDDHTHLYLATQYAAPVEMVYKIEVEFSGQYDYAPGDITITIPAQVWHGRQFEATGVDGETVGVVNPNSLVGSLELPLPEAPSKKADFNWQIIDGNYVLTNTRTIGATSSVSIEVRIADVYPMDVVDMSETDPITAHCEVVTNQGNTIELTSTPINAQLDTCAKITSAYKNGEVFETRPSDLPDSLLANLPDGADPDDYLYVRWYTYHSHVNNQPFSLDLGDVLSDAYVKTTDANGDPIEEYVTDGIFLGSTKYENVDVLWPDNDPEQQDDAQQPNDITVLNKSDLDYTTEVVDHEHTSTTGNQYAHTVYLWSAYDKSEFYVPRANEAPRLYVFHNDAEWVLTETDKAVDEDAYGKPADPQKVTAAYDDVTVHYSPVRFGRPYGRFAVAKWTEQRGYKDWSYGYALNQLQSGQPVTMNFVVETIGYGYPWTTPLTNGESYNDLSNASGNSALDDLDITEDDFGLLGWKQVTHDFQTFFNFETTPLTSEDFEMDGLRIATPSKMRYGKNSNGTWDYISDGSLPNPDLLIEYQLNNEETWYPAATATWGALNGEGKQDGAFQFIDVGEGCTTSGMTVYFPDNVTDVRHTFVSNVFGGQTAAKCDIAQIDWYVYPIITMKPSPRAQEIVKQLFEESENPTTKFKNDVTMDVYGWLGENSEGSHVFTDYDASLATYAGASYGVALNKSGTYTTDVENQRLLINYTATLTEQSNLKVRSEYDAAVEEGVIPAETSGVWYDLLPPHVVPMLDTVKLRSGDTINNIYTIEDYKGTGRTLLVVEADLTPKPVSSNNIGYADKPTLTFTAFYTWLDMEEYGKELVNYVAFESTVDNLRDDTLGTIKNQKGEPDNPLAGNNATTPEMPADIAQALTGLDPNTQPGENRFVYGKCANNVTSLTYAVSGLEKAVSNDLVGIWTQGLDGQEQVTVYEGHPYSYRLRVSSSENTVTKGIIIYDTIENYMIPDPSADEDTDVTKAADFAHTQERADWSGAWQGKGQWRGTLEKVDLTEFVNAGVAPVLLYSELPNLQFADSSSGSTDDNFDDDTNLFASGNYDISNREIWQVAQLDENGIWTVPDGINVSAIAIDATTNADGTEFVLKPEETIAGYLRMSAPDDDADPDVWNAKGAYARQADGTVDWDAAMDPDNNMYAFNNARVRLIQGQSKDGNVQWLSSYRMIRNDYTRVGIIPGVIELEKVWQDQNDHDNMRPDEVTVTVQRRIAGTAGEAVDVTDSDGQPLTATMNAENNWYWRFYQIDLVNEQGLRYLYSFKETPVEGYESKTEFVDMNHYRLINVHPNEQIPLAGEKIWADDDDAYGQRPSRINVTLYRNDEALETITVYPDAQGQWTYSFGKKDKYAEGGIPYEYRVEEEYVPKYADEVEGFSSITNTWQPYGDLAIAKTVENATPKALEQAFTFTLVLLAEQTDPDAPAVPLMDKYAYQLQEMQDGEWVTLEEGQIGNGDTFQLKHGQQLLVKDLPSESTYQVTETEAAGFTVTSTDSEGIIRAGETTRTDFTNTYAASGAAQLRLDKNLSGREIRKNQFRFELVDNNPESATYGQVIRTARVNAPEDGATTGGNGETAIESASEAIFGQLDYTEADVGKTYSYIVREVDVGASGFGYDTTEYDVSVAVTDDTGDGNLTVTPTYAKNGTSAEGIAFDNTYTAEGHLDLKAWKVLEGRPLTDGEFTFELYYYDTTAQDKTGDRLATVTNDAEGNVVFAALNADGTVKIPALNFDQNSVSLNDDEPAEYAFLIREKHGSDKTVEYSCQEYVITVKVFDNGDGTLSFAQGTQGYEREYVDCSGCGGNRFSRICYTHLEHHKDSNGGEYVGLRYIYRSPRKKIPLCENCYGLQVVDGQTCSHCYGTGLQANTSSSVISSTGWGDYYFDQRSSRYCVLSNEYDGVYNSNGISLVGYLTNPQYFIVCADCEGAGLVPGGMTITGESTIPVFENTLKPGSLSITKQVQGAGSSNPAQEFTFHVKLTGEVPAELDTELGIQPTPVPTPTPTPEPLVPAGKGYVTPAPTKMPVVVTSSVTAKPTTQPTVLPTKQPVVKTPKTPAAPFTATDLSGNGLAVLNETTGEMVFFRASANEDGSFTYNGAASDNTDVTFTFTSTDTPNKTTVTAEDGTVYSFYRNFESITNSGNYSSAWPWSDQRNTVKTIAMEGDIKLKAANYLFYHFDNLISADLSRLDTAGVRNMERMFYYCQKLQTLTQKLNTSAANSMTYMFANCNKLTALDLSTFDTKNVSNMRCVFDGCSSLTELDVSTFNTSNATNMLGMFNGCSKLTSLDLTNFDTSRVYTMRTMFNGCRMLTGLDLSSFNTSRVSDMGYMFDGCEKFTTLDLSTFDTSSVRDMDDMFYGCKKLETLDLRTFNTSRVSTMDGMFNNCDSLTTIDLSSFSTDSLTDVWAMFANCDKLETIDLSTFDVRNLKDATYMFASCPVLKRLDLSTFNTRNVTDMTGMFSNCTALEEIVIGDFNNANVTDMESMFSGCSALKTLDLTNFGTPKVKYMNYMFQDCSSLTELDLRSFNTSNVVNMFYMFNNCCGLQSIDLSSFDTSAVTDMGGMFNHCCSLTELDVSTFNTSKVTSMNQMFYCCSSLKGIDVSTFNTSKVKSMTSLFSNCSSLEKAELNNFDTSSSEYLGYMFSNCSSLTEVDVSSFNTENARSIRYMFGNCGSLTTLNLSNFYTPNVYDIGELFQNCSSLTSLDISNLDTSGLNSNGSNRYYFSGCNQLSYVVIGNNFKKNNSTPIVPTTDGYDGKWVKVDDPSRVLSSSSLFGGSDKAGAWTWHKPSYKLVFDPGEGAGSMPDAWVNCIDEYSFVPYFYRLGYDLVSFTDGTNTYAVNNGFVTIPANKYAKDKTVTLTALWQERTDIVTPTEDGYTITLRAGETVTFNDLPVNTAYEVWEETPEGWVLIQKVDDTGTIQPLETSEAVFTNEYAPEKTTAGLRAQKLMDGEGAAANAFTFTLSDASGVLQTKQNTAGGGISFDLLNYTAADLAGEASKTFTYTIAEVNGGDATITYDSRTFKALVTVSDNGEGVLSATVAYQDAQGNALTEAPVFENTTNPGSLTITKTIIGATSASAQQAFKVQVAFTDHMGQPWSGAVLVGGTETAIGADGLYNGSINGGGSITIENIPAGVCYEVSEPETLPGWQQTGTEGTTGTIQPIQNAEAALENTYSMRGVAQLSITKALTGRTLEEDEFSFALYACREDGTITGDKLGSATNAKDGTVVFSDLPGLTFTQEGNYYFAIVEEVPAEKDPTILYSSEKIVAAVIMTDEQGKGNLRSSVAYTPEAATITNEVVPGNLTVSKQVVSPNAAHQTQPFTFTLLLTDALGQPISGSFQLERGSSTSAITLSSGRGSFVLKAGESITIKGLPHGANYTITEAAAGGFTSTANGASGSITANQTAAAAFTNTYAATGSYVPTAQKSLTGKDLEADAFVFVLMDEEGYELSTGRNTADGSVTFPALSFTLDDVGTKVIQITEKDTGAPGITYDDVIQTITLTIADNGDGTLSVTDGLNGQPVLFTNTYNDKISHSVEKVWQDNENALGVRPAAVTAVLYRNRVEVDRIDLNEENGWAYTFADLPAFDEQGVKYTYEVQELPVPGYSSSVSTQGNATTLTNTVLGVMEVTKTVADGSDESAFTFTVTLTDVDGALVTGTYPATAPEGDIDMVFDANGQCQFQLHHGESMKISGLPLGASYTVVEEENIAYSSEVTEGNAEGILQRGEVSKVGFTNTIVITSLSVTKQWEGGSGYIELMLYANGELVDSQPSYTRDGDTYTYEMLPKYLADGSLITYSVKEKYVEGFVTIYINEGEHESETDRVYDGGTILNRAVTSIKVRKVWKGLAHDAVPPKIRLVLYCNGEEMSKRTPEPDDEGWYVFKNLPLYYHGEEAVYTVLEVPMDGFITEYTDAGGGHAEYAANWYTITNIALPDTGDDVPVELAIGLAAAAACGLVLLVVFGLCGKRKKK